MKKRILAVLMLTAMLLTMLGGCGKKQSQAANPGAAESGATDPAATTVPPVANTGINADLTVAIPADEEMAAVLQDHIARFQEKFPGIKIQLQTQVDLSAQTLPDVIGITADDAAALVEKGQLATLDTWINDAGQTLDATGVLEPIGLDVENLSAEEQLFYDEGTQFGDGKNYMLPLYRQSLVTYYNATYFEEKGLPSPYTWENVEQACAAIKAANPNAVPLVCNDTVGFFLALCAQKDVYYNAQTGLRDVLASDVATEVLTTLNRWYSLGYITTSTLLEKDGVLSDETGTYMVIDSTANAHKYRPASTGDSSAFELQVWCVLSEGEASPSPVKGISLAVTQTNDDDQMFAAWLLVRYLTRNGACQADIAMAGGFIPCCDGVWEEDSYNEYLNSADGAENVKPLVANLTMELQHKFFTIPGVVNGQLKLDVIDNMVNACLEATENPDARIQVEIENAITACG